MIDPPVYETDTERRAYWEGFWGVIRCIAAGLAIGIAIGLGIVVRGACL